MTKVVTQSNTVICHTPSYLALGFSSELYRYSRRTGVLVDLKKVQFGVFFPVDVCQPLNHYIKNRNSLLASMLGEQTLR